jgi:hypothetical protein
MSKHIELGILLPLRGLDIMCGCIASEAARLQNVDNLDL